jgi:[acyl-carrier-protein] S-malonyltransferase
MIDRAVASAKGPGSSVIDEASEILHRNLRAHFTAANPSIFAANRDIQLGVFLANHIHLLVLEAAGVRAELSLGLSLGEYNHLVHIGALRFADALRLVDARGAAYDEGPEGVMASVFPLAFEDLEQVVARVKDLGPIDIANRNSPTQNVLSGAREAVEAAARILDAEHGVECVFIEKRVPMHSSLFEPVAHALRPVLDAAPWRTPRAPYLPNVLGRHEPSPTPKRFAELLALHVHRPVLFRASIEYLCSRDPDLAFVEVGPRAVLFNLLSRKWVRASRFKTDDKDDPKAAIAAVSAELGAHGG